MLTYWGYEYVFEETVLALRDIGEPAGRTISGKTLLCETQDLPTHDSVFDELA